MLKKEPEIRLIDYGLAYTVSDKGKNLYIEMNKNLKKPEYSKLRKSVLEHEMLHWNAKGFWENFKIDFFDLFNLKKARLQIPFCLKHPRTYLANSPIFFENGKILANWFMVGLWGFTLLLVGGSISLII